MMLPTLFWGMVIKLDYLSASGDPMLLQGIQANHDMNNEGTGFSQDDKIKVF